MSQSPLDNPLTGADVDNSRIYALANFVPSEEHPLPNVSGALELISVTVDKRDWVKIMREYFNQPPQEETMLLDVEECVRLPHEPTHAELIAIAGALAKRCGASSQAHLGPEEIKASAGTTVVRNADGSCAVLTMGS